MPILKRKPDVIIGSEDDPYLLRWHIIPRNPWFNIYLHHFLKSDDDRALHDHPWWNISLLLTGGYIEHMPMDIRYRSRGSIVARSALSSHRIELDSGPVWTLFITGPRRRMWGFYCKDGWKNFKQFEHDNGCGEDGSAFPITRR